MVYSFDRSVAEYRPTADQDLLPDSCLMPVPIVEARSVPFPDFETALLSLLRIMSRTTTSGIDKKCLFLTFVKKKKRLFLTFVKKK